MPLAMAYRISFQMFGWRPPLTSDPPEIGQHNEEVLGALGYDAAAIAALGTPQPLVAST